jgi:hypothetical protein
MGTSSELKILFNDLNRKVLRGIVSGIITFSENVGFDVYENIWRLVLN